MQAKVYHCLPSSYLNETVEFCGMNVPVAPGNCPIYNYKQGQNVAPGYYNCSGFGSGCPQQMFFSKNVYKHPKCLNINRGAQCFEAEVTCKKSSTKPSIGTSIDKNPIVNISTISTTKKPSDSVDMNEVAQREDSNKTFLYILIVLSTLAVIGTVFVVRWFYLRRRKLFLYKYLFVNPTPYISEEDYKALKDNRHNVQNNAPTNGYVGRTTNQMDEERGQLIDKMCKGAKICQYNSLFRDLTKAMSKKELQRMKILLKDRIENELDDVNGIKEPMDLLEYLNVKYLAYFNIVFLQGLFLTAKAQTLFDICVEYARKRTKEVTFFEKKILGKDHTNVRYIINCPDLTCYTEEELKKLQVLLSTLLGAQYDDIVVCGLQNGCVIVTFMIRKCLIPKLRELYTSEKENLICQWMFKLSLKYKVVRVMIEEDEVFMCDLLMTVTQLKAEAGFARCISYSSIQKKSEICNVDVTKTIDSTKSKLTFANSYIKEENKRCTKVSQGLMISLDGDFSCMTDDTLQFMKKVLLDFLDEKVVRKMNTYTILPETWNILKLQYNPGFLNWIFAECGEHALNAKYQKFLRENNYQLECFNIGENQGRGSQSLQFHIMVFELESSNVEIKDLQNWLADISSAHPGEILMKALENKPIIITYMMKKKHANAILSCLRTDDGQIAASRHRVIKIIENGNVITIAKPINGSNFVNVRLRLENQPRKLQERICCVVSKIVQNTGLKMDGTEAYLRVIPQNDENLEFIQTHKDQLLDNLEPRTFTANQEIISMFDKEDVAKMEKFDGRREKASFFLGLCKGLPKRKLENVVQHLKEIVSSSKPILNGAELDPVRNWIKQNQDIVLEEIDSDFIETAMTYMEDISSDIQTQWSDGSKGRKDKAKIFLEYVLKSDHNVMALQKTFEENGIQFPWN
nr:uncharacterized protein LOC111131489 isoform X3 [Crassostrea virginica]